MGFATVIDIVVDLHKSPEEFLSASNRYDKRCGTQVVRGECVHLVEERGTWSRVEIPTQVVRHYDGHLGPWRGWIPRESVERSVNCLCPALNRVDMSSGINSLREKIVSAARKLIGSPYLWGGLSTGFNCSGLVYRVYASIGLLLPRISRDQHQQSEPVQAPLAGDLIFFATPLKGVRHVAIWSGEEVIEATTGGEGIVRSIPFEKKVGTSIDRVQNGEQIFKGKKIIYFGSFLARMYTQLG